MELTWSMATKRFDRDRTLENRLREKLGELEKHLERFPPDAVHLNVGLERHSRRREFKAALTLRLPSNILRVEKKAEEAFSAFDEAIRVMVRQLEDHKAGLRNEAVWKRRRRTPEAVAVRFAAAPMANGVAPETLAEIIRDLLKDNYRRFFAYVRRRVERAEAAGLIFRSAIDPRGVLDEAARQALSAPENKPEKLSYRLWIYRLIKDELTRRFERVQQELRDDISLRRQQLLHAGSRRDRNQDIGGGSEFADETLESAVAELSGILPHPEGSPGEETEHRDLLDYLHNLAHHWTVTEQHVFALHFVEGLSAFEVALVESMPEDEVNQTVASIQTRLREVLFEEAELGVHR